MRNTDPRDPKSMKLLGFGAMTLRAALLGAAACVAFAAHVAPALAGDDDDDDEPSIEQKFIRGIMHGIGAVDGNEKGIDYRERSPLVVPPKLNLPPPETTTSAAPAPNWPKDPEVEERRKARLVAKSRDKSKEMNALLTPTEIEAGRARARTATASPQPGDPFTADGKGALLMSPTALGFKGWSNIFNGDKPEEAQFTGEPARESLTQPPSGYQTPSPSYGYGLNVQDQKNAVAERNAKDQQNTILAPGKY